MTPLSSPKKQKQDTTKKEKSFCVGMILPMTKVTGGDCFLQAVDAMASLGFQVLALAEGDMESQKRCFELAEYYPKNFKIMESTAKNKAYIMKQADVLVFPTLPPDNMLIECLKKVIVPILPRHMLFQNFNPQDESGNAFVFSQGNFWEFLAAILRASENIKFEYDWGILKENLRNTEM